MAEIDYEIWRRWQDTGAGELVAMAEQVANFERRPTISLLMAAGERDELWLRDGVASLKRQCYPNWELCVCQRGERSQVSDVLPSDPGDESRLRQVEAPPEDGQSIGDATLAAATGEYVAVLGEGDELAPDALFRIVEALQMGDADVLYTDEDTIDHHGERSKPVFKPRWSPDLLLSEPYLGRICVMRRELLELAGGLPAMPPEAAEWDAMLRVTEQATTVFHVAGVLYHRRAPAAGEANAPSSVADSSAAKIATVEASLGRRGEVGRARPISGRAAMRVLYKESGKRKVSLIVQTTGRATGRPLMLLRQLRRGIGGRPDEVIVTNRDAEAESGFNVVYHASPATAANLAADEATGDVLVFVDGRGLIPGLGAGWLAELASQAARDGVGAVSGRLMNRDETVRHGGTAVDLADLCEPYLGPAEPEDAEILRLRGVLNPGAASDYLLAIEAATFRDAGGFDDTHLSQRFFGLDLALRLDEQGLRSLYTPFAPLVCRDPHRREPSAAEVAYMWRRWPSQLSRLQAERWPPNDLRRDLPPVAAESLPSEIALGVDA